MPADRWWAPIKEAKYRRRKNRLPRILTEGDSWFDYPLYRNVIDFLDDRDRWAFKRLEESGDKLQDILARWEIADAVAEEDPLVVLFSAGGNDLVADDWIKDLFTAEEPHLDEAVWQAKLDFFRAGYKKVIDLVQRPVIGHGYDYMVPSDKGVRVDGINVTGPWVKRAMESKGITDQATQRSVAKRIISDFNENLLGLARTEPNFHFVDLRGTLDPDRDWPNEMHPFERGFKRVSIKIGAELERLT